MILIELQDAAPAPEPQVTATPASRSWGRLPKPFRGLLFLALLVLLHLLLGYLMLAASSPSGWTKSPSNAKFRNITRIASRFLPLYWTAARSIPE